MLLDGFLLVMADVPARRGHERRITCLPATRNVAVSRPSGTARQPFAATAGATKSLLRRKDIRPRKASETGSRTFLIPHRVRRNLCEINISFSFRLPSHLPILDMSVSAGTPGFEGGAMQNQANSSESGRPAATSQPRGLAGQETAPDERLRLARMLHDDTLQLLTGVGLQIRALGCEEQITPHLRSRLATLHTVIVAGQGRLRRIVDGLNLSYETPPAQVAPGEASLAGLCAHLADQWGVHVSVEEEPGHCLPPGILEEFGHMVREGVANAVRHGGASTVLVRVLVERGLLRVVISDNGAGFPVRGRLDQAAECRSGGAPRSLARRVEALKGAMSVHSTEAGVCVDIAVPVHQ